MKAKVPVAIIGSGNIGTDLAERLLLDPDFELIAVVGRRADSPGLARMAGRVPHVLSGGVEELLPFVSKIQGFFDATSAFDHHRHWELLSNHGLWAIDLTPSKVGIPIVPELVGLSANMSLAKGKLANYSMVTCGGQSSAPLVYAISKFAKNPREIEVSSSIASLSAGPATRRNIEQYIMATENMVNRLAPDVAPKSILVLNPANPPVMMRTTVTVRADSFALDSIVTETKSIVSSVRDYVPGYDLVVDPYYLSDGVVSATVKVTGEGYYLPEYAGNLDIINAAAVETARRHTQARAID